MFHGLILSAESSFETHPSDTLPSNHQPLTLMKTDRGDVQSPM